MRLPNFVAIIPARGGSKGLLKKNIQLLAGKPMLAYTIEAAQYCPYIDRIIVSTDDIEIKNVSAKYGAEVFDRPESLARDDTPTADVVIDLFNTLITQGALPEYFALLQATSPLRTGKHITECIEQFSASGAASAVSVSEAEHHPYKMFIQKSETLLPIQSYKEFELPRHHLPKCYRTTGAIYLQSTTLFLRECRFVIDPMMPYIMDQQSSVDIDSAFDIFLAEALLNDKNLLNGSGPK